MQVVSNLEKDKVTVWLMGGAKLIEAFAERHLIDRVIVSVIPVAIGRGITLAFNQNDFKLVETRTFSRGIKHNIFVRNS
jgi:dihydrofolate reductase